MSLEIFQSLSSLLTDSSQVSLGLPLPHFTLSTRSKGATKDSWWTKCYRHKLTFMGRKQVELKAEG